MPAHRHSTLSDKSKILIKDDALGFEPYVRALVNMILDSGTDTPLTIGIFGPWGSGKTSLMRMVEDGITQGAVKDDPYPTVWFDAWKYDKEDVLWRALLIRVLEALRPAAPKEDEKESKEAKEARENLEQRLDDLQGSLYHIIDREELGSFQLDWKELAQGAIKGGIHFGLSFLPVVGRLLPQMLNSKTKEKAEEALVEGDLDHLAKFLTGIERERIRVFREHVTSLEQFQHQFAELVQELVVQQNKKLIVIVDDLDRCLPEKAVEVLEAIKLFLDVDGCIFLLGIDHQVIARGVEIRYRELGLQQDDEQDFIDGTRYLEKIIQLPFHIPVIDRENLHGFVSGLASTWPDLNPEAEDYNPGDSECARVFSKVVDDNPRQVKRTINAFLLLWRLRDASLEYGNQQQKNAMQSITPVRLAKVVAIQQLANPFYDVIKRQPGLLGRLEEHLRREAQPTPSTPENPTASEAQDTLSESLRHFASQRVLRELLTMHEAGMEDVNFTRLDGGGKSVAMTPTELRMYFTLSSSTEKADEDEELPIAVFEPETMPIPEGPFLMGTKPEDFKTMGVDSRSNETPQHEVHLSAYRIGKYPVTNVQYQAFIADSDHRSPTGWDADTFPEGMEEHPVVNVSWDDVTAYCEWLSEKTGKHYTLPTEAQWEKAARGEDGRLYPWGNEWEKEKLNSKESSLQQTTPVDQFVQAGGGSPYDVFDMAGNVWEWCQDWYSDTIYESRKDTKVVDPSGPDDGSYRVLRGGSFDSNRQYCRCAVRYGLFPNLHDYLRGFRIVLLPDDER